ncbi:MAG: aconitase family protein, partial [Dysgonamonadaceae bacterium]
IGSCTNSSYEDLTRAASVVSNAKKDGLTVKAQFLINPGSEQVRYTAERDGILKEFEEVGAVIIANACGPCIGQWKREDDNKDRVNSIVTSFNRNFAKRNDGNPNTHAFVASPELVAALTIAGDLCFNPLTDTLENDKGEKVKLSEPKGYEMPPRGFEVKDPGYLAPSEDGQKVEITIDPNSNRLQKLSPFPVWDGKDYIDLPLLIKVNGKCTTDHISMAGAWLRYRGHLDNISDNMLIGAVNSFNDETNKVLNPETLEYNTVPELARKFKSVGIGSVVVAEENYGEGSSREHAAMEPRHLNVKVILVKSFARIHETNLKKQGMLALTFVNKEDYNKIQERDTISIVGLTKFSPCKNLKVRLLHIDGTTDEFEAAHTYNEQQIEWFKAGSALNYMKKK